MIRLAGRDCPLLLMRYAIAVQRRANKNVVSSEQVPGLVADLLQIRTNYELAGIKSLPAEITNPLDDVEAQEWLAALELDLDFPSRKRAEKSDHRFHCGGVPIEAWSGFVDTRDLAIAAGQVASERRDQNDIVHFSRQVEPLSKTVFETRICQITDSIVGVAVPTEEREIAGCQLIERIAAQESMVGLEVSAGVVRKEKEPIRMRPEFKRND